MHKRVDELEKTNGRARATWLQMMDRHGRQLGMTALSAWGITRTRLHEYGRCGEGDHALPPYLTCETSRWS